MMPSNRFVIVSASLLCIMLIHSDSVWTQQVQKANPRIKQLQKERLAVLENAHEVATRLFQSARIEYTDLLAAQRELLGARISYAEKHEAKIKAYDEALKEAEQTLEVTKTHKEAARGTHLAVLHAQAYLLEIRIMHEELAGQ